MNDGWKSVANRIQCSLDPQGPPKQQVQVFIRELKQKAEALPNWPYVPPLIKSNVVDDLCNLQKLIKAWDTAVVWKALVEKIQRPGDAPNQDSFNKIEDLLEILKQFTVWCNTHQTALSQLTGLNLTNSQLTILPSEIGNLTQLTKLNLGSNPLTSVPKELHQLRSRWSSGISLKLRISLWFNFAMSRLSAFFESFIAHLNELQKKIRGKC